GSIPVDLKIRVAGQVVEVETRRRHVGTPLRSSLRSTRPAPYPFCRPNARSGFSSLRGMPPRTTNAVAAGNGGRSGHTPPQSVGQVPLTGTPACNAPTGASVDARSRSG